MIPSSDPSLISSAPLGYIPLSSSPVYSAYRGTSSVGSRKVGWKPSLEWKRCFRQIDEAFPSERLIAGKILSGRGTTSLEVLYSAQIDAYTPTYDLSMPRLSRFFLLLRDVTQAGFLSFRPGERPLSPHISLLHSLPLRILRNDLKQHAAFSCYLSPPHRGGPTNSHLVRRLPDFAPGALDLGPRRHRRGRPGGADEELSHSRLHGDWSCQCRVSRAFLHLL